MLDTKKAPDMEAKAFGEDGPIKEIQPDNSSEKDIAEASQAESVEKVEKKERPASEAESVVEQQVPYSRLKTVIERQRQAERDAEEARSRLAELEEERRSSRQDKTDDFETEIRERAIRLFGDTPTAKDFIEVELKHYQAIEDRIERKAYEALDKRESSSRSEIESNQRMLDEQLEDFSLALGRDLTRDEEDSLLSIADEYSPVGEDGKYLSGRPLALDKAWQIYQKDLQLQGKTSKQARSQATAATSSPSEGETSSNEEADKDWKPRFGNWRNRKDI